ncbi:MAG: hypothetical protein D3909_11570, partial [Candidatus Electrothrix sp. ATG1]|nr:hypothetical protein [Candidatus Electrothrix sp. ATG1]
MMRYKTLSFVCVFLYLFSAHNSFSIGVDPKSKRGLRKTLKKYSASRKNQDSSQKKKGTSSSGKRSSSGSTGSAGEERNRIVYTLPEPKAAQTATMVEVEDGDTIRVLLNDSSFMVTLY